MKYALFYLSLIFIFSCSKTTTSTSPSVTAFDWNSQIASCKKYKLSNNNIVTFGTNTYTIKDLNGNSDNNTYYYNVTSPTELYVTWLEHLDNKQKERRYKDSFKRNDSIYYSGFNGVSYQNYLFLTIAK